MIRIHKPTSCTLQYLSTRTKQLKEYEISTTHIYMQSNPQDVKAEILTAQMVIKTTQKISGKARLKNAVPEKLSPYKPEQKTKQSEIQYLTSHFGKHRKKEAEVQRNCRTRLSNRCSGREHLQSTKTEGNRSPFPSSRSIQLWPLQALILKSRIPTRRVSDLNPFGIRSSKPAGNCRSKKKGKENLNFSLFPPG